MPTQKSVRDLAQEFVKGYALDIQPELESGPFAIHDAGHRQANIPATIYGELLQNVHDKAAFDKLYGANLIQGNPSYYGQLPKENAYSSFVNYGFMPDVEGFNEFKEKYITAGIDPEDFEPGKEMAFDTRVNKAITDQQNDLTGAVKFAKEAFRKGTKGVNASPEDYDPAQGFMPNVALRNMHTVEPEDLNTARVRGEVFADNLFKGYQKAVEKKEYIPQRKVIDNMVHAADFADAAMQGQLKIDKGFSDEGIFPFKNKIDALSNPPAEIYEDRLPYIKDSDYVKDLVKKATDARNTRTVNRLANTVRSGFNTTTNIAGSVPLFDPEFRQATEQGDLRKAAQLVAKEYAIGAATAPIVGMGAGVLSRLGPQAASVAAGGLAIARTANPIALASQLGGSSKMTPRQEAYENQLREIKFKQAEAARRRGGKWKFPTPFGKITIPEFGISESGGLYKRNKK